MRYRFAGREFDQESGLYYMRARYYDPGKGRWISEDPIGVEGGLNLYQYSANDPVNHSDPSGTEWIISNCTGRLQDGTARCDVVWSLPELEVIADREGDWYARQHQARTNAFFSSIAFGEGGPVGFGGWGGTSSPEAENAAAAKSDANRQATACSASGFADKLADGLSDGALVGGAVGATFGAVVGLGLGSATGGVTGFALGAAAGPAAPVVGAIAADVGATWGGAWGATAGSVAGTALGMAVASLTNGVWSVTAMAMRCTFATLAGSK